MLFQSLRKEGIHGNRCSGAVICIDISVFIDQSKFIEIIVSFYSSYVFSQSIYGYKIRFFYSTYTESKLIGFTFQLRANQLYSSCCQLLQEEFTYIINCFPTRKDAMIRIETTINTIVRLAFFIRFLLLNILGLDICPFSSLLSVDLTI